MSCDDASPRSSRSNWTAGIATFEDWPEPRTIAMFQEWFDAEVVDLVFDLSGRPIEHDDLR